MLANNLLATIVTNTVLIIIANKNHFVSCHNADNMMIGFKNAHLMFVEEFQ